MECLNRLYAVGVGETMLRKTKKLDIVSVIREAVFAILSEWVQLKVQVAAH